MNSLVIYLIVILGTFYFSYMSVNQNMNLKAKRIFAGLTVLYPSIFAGIRYGIGTDYFVYQKWYDEIILNGKLSRPLEWGYILLCKIAGYLHINFPTFVFVVSLITTGCIYAFLYYYRNVVSLPYGMLTYMFMFYLPSFNLMRQFLAISIAFMGFRYLEHDKKKYVLIIIIAGLIHSTVYISLILLLIFQILKEPSYKYRIILIYIISIIFVFVSIPLLRFIITNISIFERFKYYIEWGFGYNGIGIGILRYILLFILPGAYLILKKRNNSNFDVFYAISMLGFILWLLSYISTTGIYRISYTFLIFAVPVIAYIFKAMSCSKYEKYIKLAILCMEIFWFYYDNFIIRSGEVVPYVTIFFK